MSSTVDMQFLVITHVPRNRASLVLLGQQFLKEIYIKVLNNEFPPT